MIGTCRDHASKKPQKEQQALTMFSFLRKLINNNGRRAYRIPEGLRVYAVGDVHGRADLLRRLHGRIVQDSQTGRERDNVVVYLGDYLDRGAFVRETLDEIANGLPSCFRKEYLQGNHEQLFLDFLDDSSLLETWLGLGGQATLLNYGVKAPGTGFSPRRAESVRESLLEAMPGEHLNFLSDLKHYYQLGDYVFVHAGIRPGIPLEKQSTDDLLWIRDDFLDSHDDHDWKIVHGHTIRERAQAHPHRISVDTGAYATGVLSCVILEDDQVRFLDTSRQ